MRAAPLSCKNTEKMASFPYIFPPQASALLIEGQVHREDGDGLIFFFVPFFPKADLKLKCCCCTSRAAASAVSSLAPSELLKVFGLERVVTTGRRRWKRRLCWTTHVPQNSPPGEKDYG